ncbi:MAG TPA: FRG domain-containing protein, partial [Verrucomicrobiae bacterium]|nr:FRG domain-containing protein [Verrucomicrobiae bacterium]
NIFRPRQSSESSEWSDVLRFRYNKLKRAERLLVEKWTESDLPDLTRIERHQSLRWAILQHYQVCSTPLLDVTHSLRVAASFAADNNNSHEAILYVIAVPQISGAITASAEAGLQILRLSSICPPSALRPHFQEGYLLGHYPDLQSVEEKENYKLYEVDFAKRLLCKFRLNLEHFWRPHFQIVPHAALYPQRGDSLLEIAEQIENELS